MQFVNERVVLKLRDVKGIPEFLFIKLLYRIRVSFSIFLFYFVGCEGLDECPINGRRLGSYFMRLSTMTAGIVLTSKSVGIGFDSILYIVKY